MDFPVFTPSAYVLNHVNKECEEVCARLKESWWRLEDSMPSLLSASIQATERSLSVCLSLHHL